MNELAPIVLFTYKRLDTLKLTLDALSNNFSAIESELYIFSDGPKKLEDQNIINDIRIYLKTVTGFRSINIIESPNNKGLAKSIIEGVTKIISIYGKAIVLEDDLITSKNFLNFMNFGLNRYKTNNEIFSISGYTFDFSKNALKHDGYFLNRSASWGWATWKNRWEIIDWEMKDYNLFEKNNSMKKEFSKLGSDVNKMLTDQMNGKIDSWYIRAIFHQYKIKGLTLYPSISKIENHGFDLFATNTKGLLKRYKTVLDTSNKTNFELPHELKLNEKYQLLFQKKMGYFERIINKFLETINF